MSMTKAVLRTLFPVVAAGGVVLAFATGTDMAVAQQASGDKPYTAECDADGRNCAVDVETYSGWRTYEANCARCHGPGGVGSSFAPNLMKRITEGMDYDRFRNVVANGYQGQIGVMPAWKENPNVMSQIDAMWAYLNAREDGVLGAGRPEKIGTDEETGGGDRPSNWE
jgi:mono/diheme cytochrome c family protein